MTLGREQEAQKWGNLPDSNVEYINIGDKYDIKIIRNKIMSYFNNDFYELLNLYLDFKRTGCLPYQGGYRDQPDFFSQCERIFSEIANVCERKNK